MRGFRLAYTPDRGRSTRQQIGLSPRGLSDKDLPVRRRMKARLVLRRILRRITIDQSEKSKSKGVLVHGVCQRG